jgi:SET domain-containing protein
VPPADRRTGATTVATSAIAGRGLFATESIAAGEVVVEYHVAPDTVDALGAVNHSCDPTLVWADGRALAAARDIAPGEELTCDYSASVADFLLRCHCESTRCRQMVTGDDWTITQLQQRYAGHWTTEMQRRIDAAAR